MPREDVAEVLVQSLLLPALKNRAVDLVSKPEGEGAPPTDWTAWAESELKELAGHFVRRGAREPGGVRG